jgi:KaiC/GvpD/RAD55 family RecA-like ATPase
MCIRSNYRLEGRLPKFIERLIDSDVKAELLMLFHRNPGLNVSLEDLITRIGKDAFLVRKDVEEFVHLGLLKESKNYQLNVQKDKEIQDLIAVQLAGETKIEEPKITEYRSSSGIPFLDERLSGGIPPSSAILVIGDPNSGKELLVYQIIAEALKNNKAVVYAAFDDFPERIRESVGRLAPEVLSKVDSKFLFIDYYSKLVGSESLEKYSGDPSNIMELAIMITRLLPKEEGLLVLDSASTLFQSAGVKSSIELLRRVIARVRKSKANCLISMTRGAFHPAIVAATQDLVDGVVEMKVEEIQGTLKAQLRVAKMRHAKCDTSWISYEFTPDQGLRI